MTAVLLALCIITGLLTVSFVCYFVWRVIQQRQFSETKGAAAETAMEEGRPREKAADSDEKPEPEDANLKAQGKRISPRIQNRVDMFEE